MDFFKGQQIIGSDIAESWNWLFAAGYEKKCRCLILNGLEQSTAVFHVMQ